MTQLLKSYDNLTHIKLYRIRGQVVDSETTQYNRVRASGGEYNAQTQRVSPIHVSNRVITNKDIFLIDEQGQETHHHLPNSMSNAQYRVGHFLDIYLFEGDYFEKKNTQQHVCLYNRSTQTYYLSNTFSDLSQVNTIWDAPITRNMILGKVFWWVIAPAVFLGYWVLMAVLQTFVLLGLESLFVAGIIVLIGWAYLLKFLVKWAKRHKLDILFQSFSTAKQIQKDVMGYIRSGQ